MNKWIKGNFRQNFKDLLMSVERGQMSGKKLIKSHWNIAHILLLIQIKIHHNKQPSVWQAFKRKQNEIVVERSS